MGKKVAQGGTLTSFKGKVEFEAGVLGILRYLELTLGGILMAWGAYTALGAGHASPPAATGWKPFVVWGGIFVFFGIAHHFKVAENLTTARIVAEGMEGERKVSEALVRDLPDDFMVMDDVVVNAGGILGGRKAQIDHLVVGPGGIFVIETKAYAGTLKGRSVDSSWTQVKGSGRGAVTRKLPSPITQNQYHLEVLREFIARKGIPEGPMRSVVVMTRPDSRLEISGDISCVFKGPASAVASIRGSGHAGAWWPSAARALVAALGGSLEEV